jgi:5'-3' exonuclease
MTGLIKGIKMVSKKMAKLEKKRIVIDADYLIFTVTEGSYTQDNLFADESLGAYLERFELLVRDVRDEIALALLGQFKVKKKVKICFSDPESNFRYDFYPEYKMNRADGSRSDLFYRLREELHEKYGHGKHIEADDEVANLVRRGYVGATFDKDLLKGVAGIWFDVYHSRRHIIETSEIDARNFTLIQTLMGDSSDNIPALPKKLGDPMIDAIPSKDGKRKPYKVTEKMAIELLDEFGWDWNGVVAAYKSKGFDEKEAIQNRQLIGMDQYNGKKIKMFKP